MSIEGAEEMFRIYAFFREAARLLCVEAFVATEHGDFARAVDALETGSGMLRHMHVLPADTTMPLRALAVQGMLTGPAERLLQDLRIDDEALARLQLLLLALADPPDLSPGILGGSLGLVASQREILADQTIAGFAMLDEVMSFDESTQMAIADVLPFVPSALGWVATETRFHARDEVSVLSQMVTQLPFARLSLEQMADADAPEIIFGPIPLQLSALDGTLEVTVGQGAHIRVLAAACAVRRYELSRGQWPARLEDLTTEYLQHSLLDPYSKQPLRYVPTAVGFTIYSIGDDRTDNSGHSFPEKRSTRFREIVFEYSPDMPAL